MVTQCYALPRIGRPASMPRDTPLAGTSLTSRRNPIVARYRAAAHGDLEGLLLLDGPHLVADALAAGVSLEHAIVAADASGAAEIRPLLAQLSARAVDTAIASSSVMEAVSPLRSPGAIVAIAR